MSTPPHSRAQAQAAEEKKDLVTRVKEWLTPASWLGYWGPADHTHLPPTTASSATAPSELLSFGNGYSKVGSQSSAPGLPTLPVAGSSMPSGSEGSAPSPSRRLFQERTESRVTGGGSSRSNPHVGMELESDVFGTGQAGKGPDDSDESWVAEDTGMDEPEPDSRQYHHRDPQPGTEEPPHKSARTTSHQESQSSHALLPQNPLTEGVGSRQQTTSTGLFQRSSYPFGPSSLISRVGPPATGFSSRLFTGPFTTSTPQLSPVQEENDAGATVSSYHHHKSSHPHPHPPSQPSSHSLPHPHPLPPSPSFSPAPFTTPLRLHTELSLSRSPFQSPFYSGRTSFGGAASSQRLRGKRPRTESSPPVLAPLRYSVTARPASGSGCAPSASQTARKILATLSSLSSPLADARRLPLRQGPLPEEGRQPAKRRRPEGPAPSSALSPPPTTPLVTPTQASRSRIHVPVFVPNEKTLLSRGGASGGPPSLASKSPRTTQVLQFGVPSASTTHATPPGSTHAMPPGSTHATPFSGLTFTAPTLHRSPGATPPLVMTPPTQQASPEGKKTNSPVAGFKPTFHAAQLTSVGGKMRGKPGAHYSMQKEEICVNPSPLPPAVGLSLGKGNATPSFSFAAEIKVTHATPSMAKTAPVSMATGSTFISSASMATASTVLSLGSNSSFSFAAPKSLGSQPSTASVCLQDTSYSFSAPKNCSTKSTVIVTPPLQPYTKLHPPPKAPPIHSTRPPPPLKNMSVVAALRQPEFQPVAPSNKKSDVIDLTSDEETTPPPLPPLSQFAPAAGSWSCETCSVSNKPSDKKCVCCGAAKPGRGKSQHSKLPSTGLQLGNSGGVNLGGVKLPKTSVGLQLGEVSVSTGMKLPSGSAGQQVTSSAGLKLSTAGVLKIPSNSIVSGADTKLDTTPQATASGEADSSKPAVVKLLTQFAPPAGSWTCDTCMVSNKPESDKCVACSEPKPGSKKPQAAKVMLGSAGGIKLGSAGGIKLGGAGGLKQFAPPDGSWTCDTCMVSNKPESGKCVACSEPKPGSKKPQAAKVMLGPAGGIKLGSAGGLKQFAPPDGSWTCDTCMVSNKPESGKCVACSEPKPGSKKPQAAKVMLGSAGGIKLGSAGGLKQFAPPAGSWTCDTCMVSNKPESDKCVACSEPKPGSKKPQAAKVMLGSAGGIKLGSAGGLKQFAPPAGSWTCDTCMVSNKPEASKCIACGIAKPGAVGSGKEASGGPKLSGSMVGFQLGQAGGIKLSLPGGVALGGGATQPGNMIGSGGIKLGGLPINAQEKLSFGGVVGGGANLGSGGIKLTLGDKKAESLKVSAGPTSESSQTPASSSSLKLAAQSTSATVFPALAQPSTKPNPLAGLKFGVAATSAQPTTTAGGPQLQFGVAATSAQPTTTAGGPQLQFAAPLSLPKSSAPSQPLPSFTFSAAMAANQQKTESSGSKGTLNVFSGLMAANQQKSQPSDSKIPSFVFSATKSGADSTSNSPFPTAGSASAQGGGVFGAKTNLQFSSQPSVGSQQQVALGHSQLPAPQSQLPAPPPSVFTQQTVQSGSLFTGTQQQSQVNFQFHAAGPSNDTPSLGLGGQTQSALTTPKLSFGGGMGGTNQPGQSKLQFGGSQPLSMFPGGNGGMSSGPGGTQAASTTAGFNFNASGGMNFSFGAGTSGGNAGLFTAGSNSDSGSTSSRVIKKARRRNVNRAI